MSYQPVAAGELYGLIGKLKRSHARHNDAIDAMTNDLEDGINLILQSRAVTMASSIVSPTPKFTEATAQPVNFLMSPVRARSTSAMEFSPISSPLKRGYDDTKKETKARFTVNIWRKSGKHVQVEATKKVHAKIIGGTSLPQPFAFSKQVSILAATKADAEDAVGQLSTKTRFVEVFIMASFPGNENCTLECRKSIPVYYIGEDPQKAASSISRTLNGLPPADRQRNFITKFCDASKTSPNPDRIRASPTRRHQRQPSESNQVPQKKTRFVPPKELHENIQIDPVPARHPKPAAKSLSEMLDAAAAIVRKKVDVKKPAHNTNQKKGTVKENTLTIEPQVDATLSGQDYATAQMDGSNETGTEGNNDAQMTGEGDTGGEEGETEHSQMDGDTDEIEVLSEDNGEAHLAIDESANEGRDDPFEF